MGILLLVICAATLASLAYVFHHIFSNAKSTRRGQQILGPVGRLFLQFGSITFSTKHFERAVIFQAIIFLLALLAITLPESQDSKESAAAVPIIIAAVVVFIWQSFRDGATK